MHENAEAATELTAEAHGMVKTALVISLPPTLRSHRKQVCWARLTSVHGSLSWSTCS